MRFFTLEEAEAAIPQLEKIFTSALEIKARAQVKIENIEELEALESPDLARLVIERAQLDFLAKSFEEVLGRIAEIGAALKGIEPALVDFPSHLENIGDVYLCWKSGERRITQYHGMDESFLNRKPIFQREEKPV